MARSEPIRGRKVPLPIDFDDRELFAAVAGSAIAHDR